VTPSTSSRTPKRRPGAAVGRADARARAASSRGLGLGPAPISGPRAVPACSPTLDEAGIAVASVTVAGLAGDVYLRHVGARFEGDHS